MVKSLIFLIIFIPLFSGLGQFWPTALSEVVVFSLVAILFIKRETPFLLKTPLEYSFLLFLGFVLAQLFPLPSRAINLVSVNTHNLYTAAIPGYNLNKGFFDSWRTLSVYGHATLFGFFKILAFCGAFFFTVNKVKTKNRIERIMIVIILTGVLETLYGLLEYFTRQQYIPFLVKYRVQPDIVTGTFLDRNHFAYYLGLCIPVGIGLLIARSKEMRFKVLLGLAVAIMSLAVILSGSLSGIASLLISLVVTAAIFLCLKDKRFIPVFILIGLASFLGLGRVIYILSEKGRITQWQDTIKLIKDFPVFGTGLGTYASIFPKYNSVKTYVIHNHARQEYLELLSETGILGFFIITFGFALFFWQILKKLGKTDSPYLKGMGFGVIILIINISFNGFLNSNLYIPAHGFLLSVILALVWSIYSKGYEDG